MKTKEDLIIEAGCKISEWTKTHNTGTDICMAQGVMYCAIPRTATESICLIQHITRWQCENGLSSEQWSLLGNLLITEYLRWQK